MSGLIEKFREAHKGVSPTKLVDIYFDLLSKIEECKREQDFKKMLKYCQMSVSLLEPLIEQTKNEFGTFDIKSIPAIEHGCTFWAIYGAEEQLFNLKEVVEYFPELNLWKEYIEEAFVMKELVLRIYRYVRDNEGCLQKDLKKALGVKDGSLISYVVYYMALVGKLERKKKGGTYKLFKSTRFAGNEVGWREKIDIDFEDSNKTEGQYLVIDTETTGIPQNRYDRPENLKNWPHIVQLAWILFDDEGKAIELKEYILKQKVRIPPSATEIHGITNTIMEEKGVDPKTVLNEFLEAIKRTKIIVAHNIDYDVPIIEAEFLRNGFEKQLKKIDKICTMKLGKNICKIPGAYDDFKYPTLIELFKKCFYDYATSFTPLYDKHNALIDAKLTAKCFFKLKELNKIKK